MSTETPNPLYVPETLTKILSHLDIKTLLLSQRVSRQWAELIQTSPHLQECLFFKNATRNTEVTLNPLLAEKFPAWFNTIEEEPSNQVGHQVFNKLEWASSPDVAMAYQRSDASWRRMLLRQPPLEEMLIDYTRIDKQGLFFWDVKVAKKEGIRMGLAYDYMYQAMYKCVFAGVDRPIYNHEFMFDWREEKVAAGTSKERCSRIKVWVKQGCSFCGEGCEGCRDVNGHHRIFKSEGFEKEAANEDAYLKMMQDEGFETW
ncbi:uncharacterized protein EAE98_011344 [Botrytis deweyae]|uniref:F-box domain-containing protein n=2 Tax=Botrytis TaxID=33196 RepID=A0A4Z1JHM6_9HELO|nr:uncharacterized protein EAE98_011344 [Botrytis deweyae]KAF7915021.1 hypothetical protein EAE98_011344 [Botrytis deweyae]TGO73191.1 hypothetical protein BELL_0382g00070 [Botrytis elliptica]